MIGTPPPAPVRVRDRIFLLLWIAPIGILLLAGALMVAIIVSKMPFVVDFIERFPGQSALPADAPVGIPAWLGWQHFLNGFLLLLVVRTGLQMRYGGRPDTFWTRNNTGIIRTANPPTRMSLAAWFHLSLDAFWVLNGLVYYVLLFATGQWVRIVPTSWDIFPNALSAGIQYVSLQWPMENGWVNYNALQLLTYFITVFIAAPLAIVTGIRLSPAWSIRMKKLTPLFPIGVARNVHVAVMLWFIGFTIVHVTLVLATGAVRNLGHMYASQDGESWAGVWIFSASLVVMLAAWILARPALLKPLAGLTGTVITRR